MDRYILVPMDDRFLNQHAWETIWGKMQEGDKASRVFWDVPEMSLDDFRNRVRGIPGLIVLDTKKNDFVFASWCDVQDNGWGNAHFCALSRPKYEFARLVANGFFQAGLQGLLGAIPATNELANKFMVKIGWEYKTELPGWCVMPTGERVNAHLWALTEV